MINIFGAIASTVAMISILVGPISQIIKNYKRKSCEGLSFFFVLLPFFSYIAWASYGISKDDFFLYFTQVPGSIFMLVILIQFFVYKKTKKKDSGAEL